MSSFSPLLSQLIDALRCLPGVGPKTAQRMAFYLLERHREEGKYLSQILEQALTKIGHCQRCRTFCENDLCDICKNLKRDQKLLCIVEMPIDILAIEQSHVYQGHYYVLMGHLSPLDGIGPKEIGLDQLVTRIKETDVQEIILATNQTMEGEVTVHYITELVKPLHIQTSRIARGIPLGGELEYTDSRTLAEALLNRHLL